MFRQNQPSSTYALDSLFLWARGPDQALARRRLSSLRFALLARPILLDGTPRLLSSPLVLNPKT